MRLLLTIIIIFTFFIAAITASALAEPIPSLAVTIAMKDVNQVIEATNNNDHPRINQYLQLIGVPLGSPYCASAVYTWYNDASKINNQPNPMPRSGSTASIWRAAIKNPIKYKVIRSKDILLGSKTLRGDIVIWRDGSLPEAQFLRGHTALEINQVSNKQFYSADANTSPSNIASEQREQSSKSLNHGGVYIKLRTVSNAVKFNLLGNVRVRDGNN